MYKNKKIAVVFARSKSKRLKNKLFKKISNTKILEINFKIFKKMTIIDEMIMATSNKSYDDKIEYISKNNNVNVYRGSENNVLKDFTGATLIFKSKPDIIIGQCCENPLTSIDILDQNIKNIINHKADLLSILKPSNAIFGTSSVMMNRKTLNTIYLNAKNKLHKEHIENYCYDNYKKFKIIYPIHDKKYFFQIQILVLILLMIIKVNTIFSNFNLKFGEYNFSKIINYFSKKIFIGNNYLFKYLSSTYNNRYKFTRKYS